MERGPSCEIESVGSIIKFVILPPCANKFPILKKRKPLRIRINFFMFFLLLKGYTFFAGKSSALCLYDHEKDCSKIAHFTVKGVLSNF
jgi:hypothetical protein